MFDVKQFSVDKFDAILARGLSNGLGKQDSQMCIEAAICNVMGLPHSDDPGCVASTVRSFKIALNDKQWSSPKARAEGLRDLGLAQLGSLGTVDDREFVRKLAEKLILVMLPTLMRDMYPDKPDIMALADQCETEGTRESADALRKAFNSYAAAAYASYAAAAASYAAAAASSYDAAAAAAYASAYASYYAAAAYDVAAKNRDKYLSLGAKCALDVLIEMKSPGCELLGVRA